MMWRTWGWSTQRVGFQTPSKDNGTACPYELWGFPHPLKAQGDHQEEREDQGNDVWRGLEQAGSSGAPHLLRNQHWDWAWVPPAMKS